MNLKPGNLVLVKAGAWKGKRKIKDRWDEETWEVSWRIAADVCSYEVTNQHGWSWVLHWNWLLLVMSEVGVPLCMGNRHTWDRCTSPTPCKMTSSGGDEERMPQEKHGKAVTWWPTSKASLGWKNGKLQLGLWMSTRASTEDGWRPQVKWFGCRQAEGWHLYLLTGADSELKEECYHSLNWVTAGKANQMKLGEWNGQVAHVLEWRATGLPLWCRMLLPTERYLHRILRDGVIPFKAAKLRWQSMRSCSLKEKGGYIYTPKKYPTFDYHHR